MTQKKVVKQLKPATTTPKKPAEGKKVEKEPNSPPSPLLDPAENLPEIHVDPELRDLLPRLSEGVYAALEKKLLKQKGGAQVTVNQDGVILDGHHGYEISIKHGLPFSRKVVHCEGKDDAKKWMCENQLARRNLTRFQRIKFALKFEDGIAEQAKANQKAAGGAVPEKSPEPVDVREEMAKLADTSSNTVSRVKYILEHADEETKKKLRIGDLNTSINRFITRSSPRTNLKPRSLRQTNRR